MDRVPIHPDTVAIWEFVVPSHAERCADATAEQTELLEGCYDAFEAFVVPLRISFPLQIRPASARVPHPSRESSDPEAVREVDLESADGVDLAALLDSFRVDPPSVGYAREVTVQRSRAKLRLASGDQYVDRDAGTVAYRAGEPTDRPVQHDPLSIRLLHAPFDVDGVDTEFVHLLRVLTYSDVWFGDDGLERENRTRLADFLARLSERLPVAVVDRRSERYDAATLEAIH